MHSSQLPDTISIPRESQDAIFFSLQSTTHSNYGIESRMPFFFPSMQSNYGIFIQEKKRVDWDYYHEGLVMNEKSSSESILMIIHHIHSWYSQQKESLSLFFPLQFLSRRKGVKIEPFFQWPKTLQSVDFGAQFGSQFCGTQPRLVTTGHPCSWLAFFLGFTQKNQCWLVGWLVLGSVLVPPVHPNPWTSLFSQVAKLVC